MSRPLDGSRKLLYDLPMAKTQTATSGLTVRNPKTGRIITVRGAGALKGRLKLKKNVDLTKPIASQALKNRKPRKTVQHAKA